MQPSNLLSSVSAAALLVGVLLLTSCSLRSSGSGAPAASDGSTLPSSTPSKYPDRIVLTWAEDPSSSLSVTWRTDQSVSNGQAQIALAKGEPSFFTQARTVEATTESLHSHKVSGEHMEANYHSVTFEGLEADTLYAYRVGDGEHWSEWLHARTGSAEPEPFSFIYFGDAQNEVRSHWSRVIRGAYSHTADVDFMIHAGDLVNNAHRNLEWGHWNEAGGWIQSMVPNVPVPGNHEYEAFETWMERDTFTISATINGSKMEGTLVEPDGGDESLVASRSGGSNGASPVGSWEYNIDEGDYTGTLHLAEESGGFGGRLVSSEGTELPLQNVSVDRNELSAEFIMEVEKEGPEQLSIHWHPQFTLPRNGPEGLKETVYYIDYQGMRIIGLNTNIRDSVQLERQTDWLVQTLEEADTRWTVVTMHHPMFSSGEGRSNEELRKKWTPIFDEYQVDLVMQGHDHTYARGQLKNLPRGLNTRSPVGGTVYVNSVSGAKMYEIKEERWERYEGIEMERGGENTQLFQIIHVSRDTMKYRSYTATGETYDAFNLLKRSSSVPNEMIELPVANTEERTHENTLEYARP